MRARGTHMPGHDPIGEEASAKQGIMELGYRLVVQNGATQARWTLGVASTCCPR